MSGFYSRFTICSWVYLPILSWLHVVSKAYKAMTCYVASDLDPAHSTGRIAFDPSSC